MKVLKNRKGVAVKTLEIFLALPIIAFSLIIFFIWLNDVGVDTVQKSVFSTALSSELDYNFVFNLKKESAVDNPARLFITNVNKLRGTKNYSDFAYRIAGLGAGGNFLKNYWKGEPCPDMIKIKNNIQSLSCERVIYDYQTVEKGPVVDYVRTAFVSGDNDKILKIAVDAEVYPMVPKT